MKNNFNFSPASGLEVLKRRHRIGAIWKSIFFLATAVGILALIVLVSTIVNQSFGYVAVESKVDPATLSEKPLESLEAEELREILQANLSKLLLRRAEKQKLLEDRGKEDLYNLLMDQVVDYKIVKSWSLSASLFQKDRILAEKAQRYPNAKLEFKAWLNPGFLERTMSSRPELAGVRTALKGSLLLIFTTIISALPVGIGAAIYLEEYAHKDHWYNRAIQTNIENLAGVPSIVYGILGLAIFVRTLGAFTSGAAFGIPAETGRTILSAGLTMGLLILPIIIINAQEAIRAVPISLRQAAFGLGATRWQVIWSHVLPQAMPGILTGTILAISRAIGETAPLILVGASTFITSDPTGLFSSFTALPIQIFNWTTRPQDTFRNIAGAAIIVLMVALLSLNAFAIIIRNRYKKKTI